MGFRSANVLSQLISLALVAGLLLPVGGPLSAQTAPPLPKGRHRPVNGYVAGRRIRLDAEIVHAAGIKQVRCYYRAKQGETFAFLPMSRGEGDRFRAFLPAPGPDNAQFEYLLVVADGGNRVFNSQLFTVRRREPIAPESAPTALPPPEWQPAGNEALIAVGHEIPGLEDANDGLWADGHMTVNAASPAERFGLVVTPLYGASQTAGVENSSGAVYGGAFEAGDGLGPLAWTGIGLGAAAAVGALIAAGGGGGGGGDDDGAQEIETETSAPSASKSATTPKQKTVNIPGTTEGDLVGPNLAGGWSGQISVYGQGSAAVSAQISHQGSRVTIVTSSPFAIGRAFSGSISASGSLLVYDSYDHEDWTTFYGPASANSIKIADYTNNFQSINTLSLGR